MGVIVAWNFSIMTPMTKREGGGVTPEMVEKDMGDAIDAVGAVMRVIELNCHCD